jgi:integrase/recombinase XerC
VTAAPLIGPRRRGKAPTALPPALAAAHAGYERQLHQASLAELSRRTYASKVRTYLAWLADADVNGDPLTNPKARDWAVRDYRTHLATLLKRSNTTVNNALAAIDDFYTPRRTRFGQGRPARPAHRRTPRVDRPRGHRLAARPQHGRLHPRPGTGPDPFYAGARIAEVVAVDLDDLRLSARKGTVRFYGKGGKPRTVDLHPELRDAYQAWIDQRATWPGADVTPALFLNRRGARLGVRGASDIFTAILDQAGLDDDGTAHVLRHTMATTLVRGGADLVTIAEMLGHARLDQTRRYTLPTAEDRRSALDLLPVDR